MGNNNQPAPSSKAVLIPGRRGKLFAHCYLPGGIYPRPVVMICHGIPGNERLFDFAVSLREAGFCTLSFHYSGSWGSDGDYSISHCFEDCLSVLDYIRENPDGFFDLNNVFMLGHSMGGLMTARTAALSPIVRAACIMVPMDFRLAGEEALGLRGYRYQALIETAEEWLRGLSWERFRKDAEENLDEMDLISYAPLLAEKPVLTIAASRDALLPREDHIDRLNAAIGRFGGDRLEMRCFDTDHALNDERPAIRDAVAAFFLKNIV